MGDYWHSCECGPEEGPHSHTITRKEMEEALQVAYDKGWRMQTTANIEESLSETLTEALNRERSPR